MTYSTPLFFLPVFGRNLPIWYTEDTCIIADMKASCMLRKTTPKKGRASYFETVRFYKVQHLLARSLFVASHQSQQSTQNIQYHSTAQIIQQIAGSYHRYLFLMHPSKNRCHCYTAVRTLQHSETAVSSQIAFIGFAWFSEWAAIFS